ncbi:MAG: hypothetical protein JRI76_01590 [Deltaproteobacteria bacterium]|nr:hypothetical protein [Deltaproteobacteria bacterium]MBW2040703.1 hypothetical protein [Deltaproteobacteria bacterium]
MPTPKCETCTFRGKYDANPKSILGRLWRWHAGWCPGWRTYMKSLPDDERGGMIHRYRLNPKRFDGT